MEISEFHFRIIKFHAQDKLFQNFILTCTAHQCIHILYPLNLDHGDNGKWNKLSDIKCLQKSQYLAIVIK